MIEYLRMDQDHRAITGVALEDMLVCSPPAALVPDLFT